MLTKETHKYDSESGSSLIEYVVLVGFLSFILLGVLVEVGEGSRNKLCRLVNSPEEFRKSDGTGDYDALVMATGDSSGDLNCNGRAADQDPGDIEIFADHFPEWQRP